MLRFEWDPAKDESNVRKHGFGFACAKAIFDGEIVVSRTGAVLIVNIVLLL